jgi:hypothetical protein
MHRQLYEKYGKIMKITGLPGIKNIVMVFDPNDIEKVSADKWRILCLHLNSYCHSMQINLTTRFVSALMLKKRKYPLVHPRASKKAVWFPARIF